MKAILVIDVDDKYLGKEISFIKFTDDNVIYLSGEELKPMPQKKDFFEEYMKVDRSMCKQEFDKVQEELRHQILGYNYCIDEILGDTE